MTQEQIQDLARQLESASPDDILRRAHELFGGALAIVSSFQITGILTLDMMQRIAPRTPVLTLDTGLIFPETLALMAELEARYGLDLRRVKARQTLAQQARDYGDRLWERNPDRCCHIRKTIPLREALSGFKAWVAGLRRDQSPSRAHTPIVSRDRRSGLIKFAPFANWTEAQVWESIHVRGLPYNTLHDQGYPSIGCWTCTHAAPVAGGSRAGRWARHSKSECGIHLPKPVEAAIHG